MSKLENLKGKRFNNIIVIDLSDLKDNQGKHLWNCKCNCGKEFLARTYNIKNTLISCGCKKKNDLNRLTALNQKYSTYKRDILQKGLNFDLTKDEFYEIIQKNCHYCGDIPKDWSPYIDKNGNIYSRYLGKRNEGYLRSTSIKITGVDRKDSLIGYNLDNCVPCCTKCNIMKNVFSVNDFLDHIRKINNFNE